jgi:methanogenic corrinoid protein MtbC1
MSNSNRDDDTSNGVEWSDPCRCDDPVDQNAPAVKVSLPERLASTIMADIIPRLLLSHHVEPKATGATRGAPAIEVGDVSNFVDILLSSDSKDASGFVDGLLLKGVALETVLMDLMAPAARRLGDMWTADECDFVDVTLGVSRMHALLRQFCGQMGVNDNKPVHGRKALLVPTPGEQHTFGLRIVEEFLLRDGWIVRSKLDASLEEAAAMVRADHFEFIGFTLSSEVLVSALREAISISRSESKNRSIRVIVGGSLFSKQPKIADTVGADALALEAAQAVNQARQWAQLN